jgi:nucleotide-binding universal stress UspA family protein
MHVIIATTGALSPAPVVTFVKQLIGDGGRVTVITVIEVPHSFLELIRTENWHPLADEATADAWQGEDALIARYVEERGRKLTEPVVAALAAEGLDAETVYLEGDDPSAVISKAANNLQADVVVLGATRQIFDQTAWESVSARVMIESGRPVLVVPPTVDPLSEIEEEATD